MTHLLRTINNHLKEQGHTTFIEDNESINGQPIEHPYIYIQMRGHHLFIDHSHKHIQLIGDTNDTTINPNDPELLPKITQWINQQSTPRRQKTPTPNK